MSRSPSRDRSTSRAGRTLVASAGGGGGGVTPPAYSSATGSTTAGGTAANNVFDGSDGTRWAATTITSWIRLNLTTPYTSTGYTLICHESARSDAPTAWTLEGTNDGTFASWTTLDTRTGITWPYLTARSFTFTNTTAYQYYRLSVTANFGGASQTSLAEFRLTAPTGLAALGGGTLVDYYDASTITGKINGASIAFGDLLDLSGRGHNFTSAHGSGIVFRPTGGPNSEPCLEHNASGAGFSGPTAPSPTGDVTFFAVAKVGTSAYQDIIGNCASGAGLRISPTYKLELMKASAATAATSTLGVTSGQWATILVTYTASTGSTYFKIGASSETIAGSAQTFASADLRYANNAGAELFRGSIAIAGRYASVLSGGDQTTLLAYMNTYPRT